MVITIDFSITSTGVCVLDDDGHIHFACFPFDDVIKKHIAESLIDSGVHCGIRPRNENKSNLITQSRYQTKDALLLAEELSDYILSLNPKSSDNIIAIEGFSYNSGGNRLAQISGYQFITRCILINKLSGGNFDNLYVYAPQSVKSVANAAKKGMDKLDMITNFLGHDDIVENLDQNKFYQDMISSPEKFKNIPSNRTKKIVYQKPVDDIIDAYWILKTYLIRENII